MFWVRGDGLTSREIPVPVGELVAVHDLAQDLLGGVVIAGQVAYVEVVDAGQDVREEDRGQEGQDDHGQNVVPPRDRAWGWRVRDTRVAHGGGLYSSKRRASRALVEVA